MNMHRSDVMQDPLTMSLGINDNPNDPSFKRFPHPPQHLACPKLLVPTVVLSAAVP